MLNILTVLYVAIPVTMPQCTFAAHNPVLINLEFVHEEEPTKLTELIAIIQSTFGKAEFAFPAVVCL